MSSEMLENEFANMSSAQMEMALLGAFRTALPKAKDIRLTHFDNFMVTVGSMSYGIFLNAHKDAQLWGPAPGYDTTQKKPSPPNVEARHATVDKPFPARLYRNTRFRYIPIPAWTVDALVKVLQETFRKRKHIQCQYTVGDLVRNRCNCDNKSYCPGDCVDSDDDCLVTHVTDTHVSVLGRGGGVGAYKLDSFLAPTMIHKGYVKPDTQFYMGSSAAAWANRA